MQRFSGFPGIPKLRRPTLALLLAISTLALGTPASATRARKPKAGRFAKGPKRSSRLGRWLPTRLLVWQSTSAWATQGQRLWAVRALRSKTSHAATQFTSVWKGLRGEIYAVDGTAPDHEIDVVALSLLKRALQHARKPGFDVAVTPGDGGHVEPTELRKRRLVESLYTLEHVVHGCDEMPFDPP